MSDAVSTSYGRTDLTQDVANTIEELGEISFPNALREFFPSRNMTPREYAKNHLLKRRVKFVYVGVDEEVPTACPRGWDLLVVCGVAFARRDSEDLQEQWESMVTGPGVLLGIPLASMNVVAQLRELMALRVLSSQDRYDPNSQQGTNLMLRQKFVQKQLRERARKALAPSAFRWKYQGEIVEEAPVGTRNLFISGFLQSIYHMSPRVSLAGSRRCCVDALDELLDLAHPLQISNVTKQGAVKILRRFMVDTGIFTCADNQGGYSRYEVAEYVSNAEWGPIWNRLIGRLIGDGSGVKCTDLKDYVTECLNAPLGLCIQAQAFLLAAVMRRAYPDLSLELDGEPRALSGTALLRALANPKGWQIAYRPATENEMQFLKQVRELFATGNQVASGMFVNIWDRTLRSITAWYLGLSGIAKIDKESMSVATQGFVALITDSDKRQHPNALLGEQLPELYGTDGIPWGEEQQSLLAWFAERKRELEARVDGFRGQLCAELGQVLGGTPLAGGADVQWLDDQYRAWLGKLHAGSLVCPVGQGATELRLLREADASVAEKWFVVLPKKLGLPAVEAWTRDMTSLYKARLTKACIELETWSVHNNLPWKGEDEGGDLQVARWMTGVFDGLQLTPEQRESVLLDVLEEMV